MSELGRLSVTLRADTATLESDLGRAHHIAEREMERMVARAAAAGELIGRAVGAGLTKVADMVASTLRMGDELAKLAQRTGMTVERLSELRFAGDLADVSFAQLGTSLGMFNKALAEAQNESTKTGQLMRALGVDIHAGPQKAFEQFIAAINKLPDGETKVAAMRVAFGRAGDAMIPFASSMTEATEKARKLGLVMSEGMAKDSERFADSMKSMEAAGRAWIIGLAPAASGLATITDHLVRARERGDFLKQSFIELNKVIAATFSVIPGMDERVAQYFIEMERLSGRAGGRAGATGSWGDPAAPMGPPTPADMEQRTACAVSGGKWVNGACQYEKPKAARAPRDQDLAGRQWMQDQEEWNKTMAEAAQLTDEFNARLREREALQEKWNEEFLGMTLEEIRAWEELQFKIIDTNRAIEDNTARAAAGFDEHGKALEKTLKKTDSMARELGLTFTSAFEDAVISGKKLSEVLKGLAQDLARIVFRKTVTEPLAEKAGGILKDVLGGIFKTKPVPGGGGGGDQLLGAFAEGTDYVPRTGLALLHQGEAVVPAGQNRATSVNITIHAADARSVVELFAAGGGDRLVTAFVERAFTKAGRRSGMAG